MRTKLSLGYRTVVLLITICCVLSACAGRTERVPAEVLPNDVSPSVPDPAIKDTEVDAPSEEEPSTENPEVVPPVVEDPPIVVGPPTLEEGATQSLLVYDFLNSCLDWHVSIHRDEFYSDWYILRYDECPDVLYVDWYVIQDSYTLPPRGSAIETHELSTAELEVIEEMLSDLSEDHVVHDNGWTLYMLTDDSLDTLYDNDLSIWSAESYTNGPELPFLADGTGYPTEWLRREPYATKLRNEGVDIQSAWWDEWNYLGVYELIPYGEDTERDFTAILTCVGNERFHYDDGSAYTNQYLTWNDIVNICNSESAYVPEHYDSRIAYIG